MDPGGGESLESKYKRLVVQYAKVKAHNGVLRDAVVGETDKIAALEGKVVSLQQRNRALLKDNDVLSFNNNRLTQRVAVLTRSSSPGPGSSPSRKRAGSSSGGGSSWWGGSSAKQARIDELSDHVAVLEEQLAQAIAQVEHYGSDAFEAQRVHAEEVATLNGHVRALEAALAERDSDLEVAKEAARDAADLAASRIAELEAALAAVSASYEGTLTRLHGLQGELDKSLANLNDSHFGGVAPFFFPLGGDDGDDTTLPLDGSSLGVLDEAAGSLISALESSFMAWQASAIALATPEKGRTPANRPPGSPATPSGPARATAERAAASAVPALAAHEVGPALQHALAAGSRMFIGLGRYMQARAGTPKYTSPKMATLAGQCFTSLSAIAAALADVADHDDLSSIVDGETGELSGPVRSSASHMVAALRKVLPYLLASLRVEHQVMAATAPQLKAVNNAIGPLFATMAANMESVVSWVGPLTDHAVYVECIAPLVDALDKLAACYARSWEVQGPVLGGTTPVGDAVSGLCESITGWKLAMARFAGTGSVGSASSTRASGPAALALPARAQVDPLSPLASPMAHQASVSFVSADAAETIARLKAELAAKNAQLIQAASAAGPMGLALSHDLAIHDTLTDTQASAVQAYDTPARVQSYYEGRMSEMERSLSAADARAGEMYQTALTARHENKELQANLDAALAALSSRDDELETTRRNYEEQLNTLTNHICALNAKLASSQP